MADFEEQAVWFVYIIETKYKHLYTGITLDWKRRFQEHNTDSYKTAKALKGKGPLTLKYVAQLNSKSDALKAEIWIKRLTKTKKNRIIENKDSLPFEHQTCPFNTF